MTIPEIILRSMHLVNDASSHNNHKERDDAYRSLVELRELLNNELVNAAPAEPATKENSPAE